MQDSMTVTRPPPSTRASEVASLFERPRMYVLECRLGPFDRLCVTTRSSFADIPSWQVYWDAYTVTRPRHFLSPSHTVSFMFTFVL